MPMTPALRRQREEDPNFKVILSCIVNLRLAWAFVQPCLKNKQPNKLRSKIKYLCKVEVHLHRIHSLETLKAKAATYLF